MNGQPRRFSHTGRPMETSPAGKTSIAACRLIRLTSTWNSAEHPQSVFRMGQPPEAGRRASGTWGAGRAGMVHRPGMSGRMIPSRLRSDPWENQGPKPMAKIPPKSALNLLRAGDNLKHPIMSVIRYEVPY